MDPIPIDKVLCEELERPQDLGTTIDDSSFFAAPADQPIAFPLGKWYETSGRPRPPELSFYEAYELWVVPHGVSIMRRSGMAEVTAVGLQVKYQTGKKTCCVKSVLPSYRFIDHGGLSMRVEMGGNAEADPCKAIDALRGSGIAEVATVGDLKIHAKVEGDLKFFFSANVATPDIQAVGEGSSGCEWRFDRSREPLFGRDIQTWSVVVLPRRQKVLTYSMRFYLNVRTFFFTTRRESDWVKLDCKLEGGRT